MSMSFAPPDAGKPIRVGVVGANPERGWGSSVHIPVLAHLEQFSLHAVVTTRPETARRSAEAFGAPHFFTSVDDMIGGSDVDLVTIAVKAPEHYRLALAALEAGKHVYCEWPLAVTVEQASRLQACATRQGVAAVVGLQARGAPALRRLRHLVADGYVGEPVAVRLRCALPGGGRRRSREGLYVVHKENGASTLAVHGGHAIDALRFCVGELAWALGIVATHYCEVEIVETGERVAKDAPDQVAVSGMLASGAVVSALVTGGVVSGHGIELEVFGEEGTLSAGWAGTWNFQMSPLSLRGARAPDRALRELAIPDGYDPMVIPERSSGSSPYPGVSIPRATLVNVANLYLDLADAIRAGGQAMPDFAVGLSLHRVLDMIASARSGGG
jgi:predicted dehydrogenase